jgi:hypothetical protein
MDASFQTAISTRTPSPNSQFIRRDLPPILCEKRYITFLKHKLPVRLPLRSPFIDPEVKRLVSNRPIHKEALGKTSSNLLLDFVARQVPCSATLRYVVAQTTSIKEMVGSESTV